MLRIVSGVIVGYIIFAVPALLLFFLSGQKAHAPASRAFMLGSIIYGMVFAFLGGWVAATFGKRRVAAVAVGVVIAVGAVISLVASPAGAAVWSQLAALLLIAPSAMLAARTRKTVAGNHL